MGYFIIMIFEGKVFILVLLIFKIQNQYVIYRCNITNDLHRMSGVALYTVVTTLVTTLVTLCMSLVLKGWCIMATD